MKSPEYILEPGTVIVTHAELGETTGMLIKPDNLNQRRPNTVGVIGNYVAGHGGDVYWVYHAPNQPPAAYSYDEIELSPAIVRWKITQHGLTTEVKSLQDAWEIRKLDSRAVVTGPFIQPPD